MKQAVKSLLQGIGLSVKRMPKNYRPDLVRILEDLSVSLVFDVGANVGQFSSNLRRHGYSGRIVSFEPILDAHTALRNNAANDELWHVHDRTAIGDRTGTVKINVAGREAKASSILEMRQSYKESAPHSRALGVQEVPITTIDSIFSKYANVNDAVLLKIDVQGYEKQVIEGAKHSLEDIRAFKLELSLASLYEGDEDYRFYFSYFEDLGFEIWDIEPGHRHAETGRLLQFDAVFAKSLGAV